MKETLKRGAAPLGSSLEPSPVGLFELKSNGYGDVELAPNRVLIMSGSSPKISRIPVPKSRITVTEKLQQFNVHRDTIAPWSLEDAKGLADIDNFTTLR